MRRHFRVQLASLLFKTILIVLAFSAQSAEQPPNLTPQAGAQKSQILSQNVGQVNAIAPAHQFKRAYAAAN